MSSNINNNISAGSSYVNPLPDEYDCVVHENKKALLYNPGSAAHDGSDQLRVSIEERRSCCDLIKNFLSSDKSIVLIAKLSMILTGMIGSLYLFIVSSEFDIMPGVSSDPTDSPTDPDPTA